MISQEVVVKSGAGIHARPAEVFIRTATEHISDIFVEKAGKSVSAKEMLDVLSLNITTGNIIKLTANGADEKEALDDMVEFVESLRAYM